MNGTYHDVEWQPPNPLAKLENARGKVQGGRWRSFCTSNQSNRLLLHIDEHRSMSALSRVQARSNAACWLSPSEMSGDCHLP